MSTIFNCINQNCLDIEGFVEPSFGEAAQNLDSTSRIFKENPMSNTPIISTILKFHNNNEIHEIFTPSRIENARGNVTFPLESTTNVGDLNRQRCKDDYHKNEHFGIIEISVEDMPIKKLTWDILFSIDVSLSMTERCRDGKSKLHHIKHTMSNILLLFSKNNEAIFNVCVHVFNETHKEIFDFDKITADNVDRYIQLIKYITADRSTNLKIPLEMCEKKYQERKITYPDNKFVHIELTDGEDTANNTDENLISHVSDSYKNIVIGFGSEHNSELLEMFTSNCINEYRFIDKTDKSGYVYGEIIHNLLYTFVDNAHISVLNGLIYDWKTNEWTHSINIGSISTGSTKTFHIKTTTPNLMTGKLSDNITGNILSYIEVLPETMDISGNPMINSDDLTKYMFRQKVQELIYMAKKAEDTYAFKKILKEFFLSMKVYVETNQLNDDIFWKVLLDDIYIVYKTMGKSYAHMYTTTRQVSQGRQYSCNTEDFEDEDNDKNDYYGFDNTHPMLVRQTNCPDTQNTQQDIIDEELMEKYFMRPTGVFDSVDTTINYNDINDDDNDILNHNMTLTQDTLSYSHPRMSNIIDFIHSSLSDST